MIAVLLPRSRVGNANATPGSTARDAEDVGDLGVRVVERAMAYERHGALDWVQPTSSTSEIDSRSTGAVVDTGSGSQVARVRFAPSSGRRPTIAFIVRRGASKRVGLYFTGVDDAAGRGVTSPGSMRRTARVPIEPGRTPPMGGDRGAPPSRAP